MPDSVDACARSILDDNPEMDEATAHAICQDMESRGVLEAFNEADDGDEQALAALAEFRNPGDIQRVAEGGDIRYKRVMLLAPGVWTDAGSRETVLYDGTAIRESADDWTENQVNLLHGPALHNASSLADVGEVDLDSLMVDDQDRLYGDVVLHGDSAASELAIDLMDEALETGGQQGIDGPSVEIVEDDVQFDSERGLSVMESMTFGGIGLVFNPASEPVDLANQMRERAVAMAEAEGYDHTGLMVREGDVPDSTAPAGPTQSLKSGQRPGRLMGSEREQMTKLLGQLGESIEEMSRILQGDEDLAVVQDLISQYEQEGNDLSDPAAAFAQFAEEQGADMDVVEDVLGAYLDAAGAESLDETPVEALNQWLSETMADTDEEGDGDGEGEGEEEDEGEAAMSEDELQQAKETIAQFNDHLGDVKDMLSGVVDEVDGVAEDVDEVDRRLSKLEDEPAGERALTAPSDSEFIDSEDPGGASAHEDAML